MTKTFCVYKEMAELAAVAAEHQMGGISLTGGRADITIYDGLHIRLYGRDGALNVVVSMDEPETAYTDEGFEKLALSFREMFGVDIVDLEYAGSCGWHTSFHSEGDRI